MKNSYLWMVAAVLLVGCAAEVGGDGVETLDGEDDLGAARGPLLSGNATLNAACKVQVSVDAKGNKLTGSQMFSTATSTSVVRLLVPNSVVKIVVSAPSANGRYKVEYGSPAIWGWIAAADLTLVHNPNAGLSTTRTNALARARTAMGFSYWWSNARWPATGTSMLPTSNIGLCTGSCGNNCTHAATGGTEYGADCAGFISTIWGYPDYDSNTNPTNNGYGTVAYNADKTGYWSTIAFADALPGDAVVTYSAGDSTTQHIYMVAVPRDGRNRFMTYQCKGCSSGCLTEYRTVADGDKVWHAIRRASW